MSLKFTGEFFLMTMKKEGKLEEKLTCRFKLGFDPNTLKSQKFALKWAAFDQSMKCLS